MQAPATVHVQNLVISNTDGWQNKNRFATASFVYATGMKLFAEGLACCLYLKKDKCRCAPKENMNASQAFMPYSWVFGSTVEKAIKKRHAYVPL